MHRPLLLPKVKKGAKEFASLVGKVSSRKIKAGDFPLELPLSLPIRRDTLVITCPRPRKKIKTTPIFSLLPH